MIPCCKLKPRQLLMRRALELTRNSENLDPLFGTGDNEVNDMPAPMSMRSFESFDMSPTGSAALAA
jgi:hypothetical protein